MALLPRGSVRFVDVPVVTMPIAARDLPAASPAPTSLRRVPMLASPEPDPGGGPPTEIDPQLLEHASVGDLPRTAPQGRTPLRHYARPTTADCRRPCVAVLVTGLGLANRLTVRALTLPGRGRAVVLALCRCCRLAGARPSGRPRGAADAAAAA